MPLPQAALAHICMCGMSHGLRALSQALPFAGPGVGEPREAVLFSASIPSRLACGSLVPSLKLPDPSFPSHLLRSDWKSQ